MSDFDQQIDDYIRDNRHQVCEAAADASPPPEELVRILRPIVADDRTRPDTYEAACRRRLLGMAVQILNRDAERDMLNAERDRLKAERENHAAARRLADQHRISLVMRSPRDPDETVH